MSRWLSDPNDQTAEARGRRFFGECFVSFKWCYIDEGWVLVPADNGGFIPPFSAWQEICDEVRKFYQVVDEETISQHNQETMKPGKGIATARPSTKKRPRPGYVYVVEGGGYYKIGYSSNPDHRIGSLNTQPPFDLEIIRIFEVADMRESEAWLHEQFADKRVQGEWFELDNEDIDWIMSLEELYK